MARRLWSVILVVVGNFLPAPARASGSSNSASTLAAILTPANDVERWKVKYEAEIVGYVYDGKPESVNCGALVLDRDTHVELVLTGPCFTSFLSRHYRPRTSPSNVPCRCRERGWLPKLYAKLISPVPGAREQSSGSSSG